MVMVFAATKEMHESFEWTEDDSLQIIVGKSQMIDVGMICGNGGLQGQR
jgi:hypothetical protein